MSDSVDDWLAENPLPGDLLPILARWLDEAFTRAARPNPHAVALAPVDERADPAVRYVLYRAIELDRAGDESPRRGQLLPSSQCQTY